MSAQDLLFLATYLVLLTILGAAAVVSVVATYVGVRQLIRSLQPEEQDEQDDAFGQDEEDEPDDAFGHWCPFCYCPHCRSHYGD